MVASRQSLERSKTLSNCFNPLHCGAVVASNLVPWHTREDREVSIPFIAGQWSLLWRSPGRFGSAPWRFNPLHCGAVVASIAYASYLDEPPGCFNPLHCGAVVASFLRAGPAAPPPPVSIPFIAGQWSLRGGSGPDSEEDRKFQSPSLRGSGRFRARRTRRMAEGQVSIPFIAGQWSLPDAYRPGVLLRAAFQSPSLRGSGRFQATATQPLSGAVLFQSPSLRGSGRFDFRLSLENVDLAQVSIPFIAGQWSLPPDLLARLKGEEDGFNPLHCGAVVASGNALKSP